MINRFTVEGRLTRNVELKKTQKGTSAVEFDIACTRNRKNDAGEYESDFFTCKAYSMTAEYIANHGKKGMRAFLEGRMQVRRYEGRDGTQRTVTELIVDNVSLIDVKTAQNTASTSYNSESAGERTNTHETQEHAKNGVKQALERYPDTLFLQNDDIADDLPF